MFLILYQNELLLNQCTTNRRYISTGDVLRNYYKVLNLSRNCTTKEIKDSFIRLSKEHHPDLNKSIDAHDKFLKINEAYKVLSKSESRRLYDLTFSTTNVCPSNKAYMHYGHHFSTDPLKDPSFYNNRDKSQDEYYRNRGYYGIKGIKKVSNFTVAVICASVTAIMLGLQIILICHSFTFRRDEMIRRSEEADEFLRQARDTATSNGNNLQLELLKLRLGENDKYT